MLWEQIEKKVPSYCYWGLKSGWKDSLQREPGYVETSKLHDVATVQNAWRPGGWGAVAPWEAGDLDWNQRTKLDALIRNSYGTSSPSYRNFHSCFKITYFRWPKYGWFLSVTSEVCEELRSWWFLEAFSILKGVVWWGAINTPRVFRQAWLWNHLRESPIRRVVWPWTHSERPLSFSYLILIFHLT